MFYINQYVLLTLLFVKPSLLLFIVVVFVPSYYLKY